MTRGLETLRSRAPIRLSAWAEQHFYLSSESSYVEGRFKPDPFQIAILDCMGHDGIESVDVQKSARVGYTKMLLAALGYNAEHKRRNAAVWQPTDGDAEEFVKTELDPMLRDVVSMRRVLPSYLSRHRNNTLRQKIFAGRKMLHIRGGAAAKNYRRISVDLAVLDETDGFDPDVEKEGSPVDLARKRLEGATFPKFISGSTPKLKGWSLVEARFEAADLRMHRYQPCPHCQTMIRLEWGGHDKPFGFKWVNKDPETAAHLCGHCGGLFTQAEYLRVADQGRWIAQDGTWYCDASGQFYTREGEHTQPPRAVAFHVWTAYSPRTTWAAIVREFHEAQAKAKRGDTSSLKTFVNTTLGETWAEAEEKTEADSLKARAGGYARGTVPMGCLVLTAGIDVQDDRFELSVWGWGEGEESWLIDHLVIYANTADLDEWAKLDGPLLAMYRHAGGQVLSIEAAALDTGGHRTHQAYMFCRDRKARKVLAAKGSNKDGQPIKPTSAQLQDINWQGKKLVKGVRLWQVGTDTAKDLIHGRFSIAQPGPGYVHFPSEMDDGYYAQLTAEARVLQRTPHGEKHRWVKRSPRNEALDCYVYAMFAAHYLELHRWTKARWATQRNLVQPPVADLFGFMPEPDVGPTETTIEHTDRPADLPHPVVTRHGEQRRASSYWSR